MHKAFNKKKLSELLNDFEDKASQLQKQSAAWKIIKSSFGDSPFDVSEATVDKLFFLSKMALGLYYPHKILERQTKWLLAAEVGEEAIDYFLMNVPESEWSSSKDFSPLLGNALLLLNEIHEHKIIYSELLNKKSILARLQSNRIQETTPAYGSNKLSRDRMTTLISKISHLFSYDTFSGSSLTLQEQSEQKTKYIVITQNDRHKRDNYLHESRFYFLWYLCYVRIKKSSIGLERGSSIPQDIYSSFDLNLRQSLSRGWNDHRNPTEASAQQAKYKSDINKKFPELVELIDGNYIINKRIDSSMIKIPYIQ